MKWKQLLIPSNVITILCVLYLPENVIKSYVGAALTSALEGTSCWGTGYGNQEENSTVGPLVSTGAWETGGASMGASCRSGAPSASSWRWVDGRDTGLEGRTWPSGGEGVPGSELTRLG